MYCECCKNECEVISLDFGIGKYEFWGDVQTDIDFRTVSECCHATAWSDKRHVEEEAEDE